MTLFSTVKLEIAMPIAVISALIVGAVLAGQKKPQKVEINEEEIITAVAPAVEPEPEPQPQPEPVEIEPIEIPIPPAPKKAIAPQEELGTSKLELVVPEGATVWLGKKKLGVAPIEAMEIVEGRHLIRVDFDKSTFSEWVDVPPGATFTYRLTLSEDAPVEEERAPSSK